MNKRQRNGFTIVELLIVIVVIAILAAITIVAYNGIQRRAHNTAKKSAVASISKLLSLYKVEHGGGLPVMDDNDLANQLCLTRDNQCVRYNGNAIGTDNSSLIEALSKYGTVPGSSGDATSGQYHGIVYMYNAVRTLNGVPNNFVLLYWLEGNNQDCTGVAGMTSVRDSGTLNDMTPGVRAKGDLPTGQTRCYLMFE